MPPTSIYEADEQVAGPSTAPVETASVRTVSERDPLLPGQEQVPDDKRGKPFYRPRQLWLVPFFLTAAIVRGMTLAPRLEVFTMLSCREVQHEKPYPSNCTDPVFYSSSTNTLSSSLESPHHLLPPLWNYLSFPDSQSSLDRSQNSPRSTTSSLPTECVDDPKVQAGAAKLQAILTTTMGLLSAITSGWWGHFGERHGRLKVMAISTLGLLLTDLTFTLISMPSLPFLSTATFHRHARVLLILSPAVEGLLGGWSSLQSACTAYVSDCTSPGSRAHNFSRLLGTMFLGVSFGPALGGWILRHAGDGIIAGSDNGVGRVNTVFFVALCMSTMNLLLALFVFPESLSKEKREAAQTAHRKPPAPGGRLSGNFVVRLLRALFAPMAVFLPVWITTDASGLRKRRDWSLTLLAGSFFLFLLSTGVYQIKYLYAKNFYHWDVEKLSYYITFIAGARAIYALFILPMVIAAFKPKPTRAKATKKPTQNGISSDGLRATATAASTMPLTASVSPHPITSQGQATQPPRTGTADTIATSKSKPSRAQLGREIHFDLILAKCGMIIDIISNVAVAVIPAPGYKVNHSLMHAAGWDRETLSHSSVFFIVATGLASFGSGTIPALQSIALSILQAREYIGWVPASGSGEAAAEDRSTGRLIGALAVLQALGQMIIGPILFGLVYSTTVANYPQAVFTVTGAIILVSFVLVVLIQSPIPLRQRRVNVSSSVTSTITPRGSGTSTPVKGRNRAGRMSRERGRSRASKDLSGGAFGYTVSPPSSARSSYGSLGDSPVLAGSTHPDAPETAREESRSR